jgi:hypothetical protein
MGVAKLNERSFPTYLYFHNFLEVDVGQWAELFTEEGTK